MNDLNERQEAIAVLMGFSEIGIKNLIYMNGEEYYLSMDWLYPVCQKIINDPYAKSVTLIPQWNKLALSIRLVEDPCEIFINASDFAMEWVRLNKK